MKHENNDKKRMIPPFNLTVHFDPSIVADLEYWVDQMIEEISGMLDDGAKREDGMLVWGLGRDGKIELTLDLTRMTSSSLQLKRPEILNKLRNWFNNRMHNC